MPKYIDLIVDGIEYTSIKDAWENAGAPDLPLMTVYKRINEGWDMEKAVVTRVIEPAVRYSHDRGT